MRLTIYQCKLWLKKLTRVERCNLHTVVIIRTSDPYLSSVYGSVRRNSANVIYILQNFMHIYNSLNWSCNVYTVIHARGLITAKRVKREVEHLFHWNFEWNNWTLWFRTINRINDMSRMRFTVDNLRRFLHEHDRPVRILYTLVRIYSRATNYTPRYAGITRDLPFRSRNYPGLITLAEVCVSDYAKFCIRQMDY